MQDAVFAALFVVQDELDGDTCAPRPIGLDRLPAVADQVALIAGVRCHGKDLRGKRSIASFDRDGGGAALGRHRRNG
jgi:hypothetical protein